MCKLCSSEDDSFHGVCLACAKKIRLAVNKFEQGGRKLFALTPEFKLPGVWCEQELERGFTMEILDKEATRFVRYFSNRGDKRTEKGWKKSWVNWLNKYD